MTGDATNDTDDDAPIRQTIYVRPSMWRSLRQVSVDEGPSASAQVVALIEWYLSAATPEQRADIVTRARAITRGNRGRPG